MFEAGAAASALGVEAEAGVSGEGGDREDIPDVQRDYVGYQGVNVGRGVDDFAFLVGGVDRLDVVPAGALGGGAFDLYPEQALAVVEDEVVALGIAPGAGDAEAEAGGFE